MARPSWRRWPRIAWLIVLPLLLIGVIAMKEFGRRQRAASANYEAVKRPTYARWHLRWAEVQQVTGQSHKHEVRAGGANVWSPDDLKRAIPGLAWTSHETHTSSGHRYDTYNFTDPLTGYY